MKQGDRKRFVACLMACAEIYGRDASDAVIGIWWAALEGHEFTAVEAAFARHMKSPDTGQFMPKPADILRMLTGTSIDAAMVAWAKVDKAVRQVGPYASVTFDDPIIQRVLQDMGGWIMLCGKTDDEWPFVGNEFRTRYQGFRSRAEVPPFPSVLIGIAEADPKFPSRQHVLLGDTAKARALVDSGGAPPKTDIVRLAEALPQRRLQ